MDSVEQEADDTLAGVRMTLKAELRNEVMSMTSNHYVLK